MKLADYLFYNRYVNNNEQHLDFINSFPFKIQKDDRNFRSHKYDRAVHLLGAANRAAY